MYLWIRRHYDEFSLIPSKHFYLLFFVFSLQGCSIVGKDKAEILELAVAHIAQLQDPTKATSGKTDMTSYKAGYRECAQETVRYLSSKRAVADHVIKDVDRHLSCICDKNMTNLISQSSSSVCRPEPVRMNTPPLDLTPTSMSATSRRIYNRHLAMSSTPQTQKFSLVMSPLETYRPYSNINGFVSNLSSPGSSIPSPALSSCSTSTFDSGISLSGTSDLSIDKLGESESFNDNALVIDIKEEKPWRPWWFVFPYLCWGNCLNCVALKYWCFLLLCYIEDNDIILD